MTEKPDDKHPEDVALQKLKSEADAMQKIVKALEQVEAGKRWKIVRAAALLLDVDLEKR